MTDPNPIDPQDPPEDPTDPPEDPEEWTPPSKEDHEKMTRALTARKKERDDARRELAALKAGTGKPPENTPPADPDMKTKRQAALAGLTGAGMTKEQAKKAIKLMDLDAVEVDEDGDADVDDALADLKTAFPGLFPAGRRAPKVDQADRGGNSSSVTDKTSDRLLKQAGYR